MAVTSEARVQRAPSAPVDATVGARQRAAAVPTVVEPLAPTALVIAQEAPAPHPRPGSTSVEGRGVLKEATEVRDARAAPEARAPPAGATADTGGPLLAAPSPVAALQGDAARAARAQVVVPALDGPGAAPDAYAKFAAPVGGTPLATGPPGIAAMGVAVGRLHRTAKRPLHAGPPPPVVRASGPVLGQRVGRPRTAATRVAEGRRGGGVVGAGPHVAHAPLRRVGQVAVAVETVHPGTTAAARSVTPVPRFGRP